MIVNFIGQGIESEDNESVGRYICTSLADDRFNQYKIISAFASKSAIETLSPYLKVARERKADIQFFIGIDDNGTSKEALEYLLENSYETYIFYTCSKFIFHPKIYLFQGDHNRLIIGSANLTKYGLFHNIEAAILIDFNNDDYAGRKIIKQILESFKYIFDRSDENLMNLDRDLIDILFKESLLYQEKSIAKKKNSNKVNNLIQELFPERKCNQIIKEILATAEINETKQYKRTDSSLKITQEYLDQWDIMFQKLLSFKSKYKSTVIPKDHPDRTLYGWFRKQKTLNKNQIIPVEHKKKLDAIGFFWDDGHILYWQNKWEKSFNELMSLKGQSDFPNIKRHKERSDRFYSLSNWVVEQRVKYKRKLLTEDQIKRLEKIGFKWNMRAPILQGQKKDDNWFDFLLKLKEYKQEHGDCNVSQTAKEPNIKKLGKWLNDQRTLRKQGRLPDYRIDLLNDLEIIWDMDVYKFENFVKGLIKFKNENGNFDVPLNYAENPALGNYIYRIKTSGLKDEWKISKLNSIGFFDIGNKTRVKKPGRITKDWKEKLNDLEKLTKTGINPNLPDFSTSSPVLYRWLYNQKKSFRLGRLKQTQIDELKRIGIILQEKNSQEIFWDDMYEYYKLYIKEYKTKKVSFFTDKSLHYWITNQRTAKKLGLLSEEKLKKLEEIGFQWNVKI